ncbi:hypothetical protein OBK16_13590 [Empedobacter falsenii]|uniref:hypothetical protein n=1 Tax=Empedobacter stercoris TaxID=1628248 RepID=UPI001CE16B4C|nr:hypothetical protein [Empedobacter stercoris]MCA4777121.1 hypothetical protein [Empedobacter stercoris]
MKSITFLVFFFFNVNFLFCQFQGELFYHYEIASPSLNKLKEGLSNDELRKATQFADTVRILIKDNNFITLINNKLEEKKIVLESEKTEYTISKILLPDKGKKVLTKIDLTSPLYNKDNFTEYSLSNIVVENILIENKECKKHLLFDQKITETFVVCDELPSTSIVRNYLIPPYTGQNLNSKHYEFLRNKIIYSYEMQISAITYKMRLVKINSKEIDNNDFVIPKTNSKGIILK